ncbi:hypothetical protein [Microbulbifer spongiae]|uniref:Uncharacterized protein n=1 Tax=Microbulbifer spongiae TaxID=2944933 RepID=A0ABY9EC86_9GAMM|nr:hypothetical protein [Microbulbifer sp. MI-G]WKD48965.1 hypothetical protein M8T91_13835 [Microbulbifer sp. MI-G]
MDFIYSTIRNLNILQTILIWFGHWIGRFFVVSIFLSALAAIVYQVVYAVVGIQIFSDESWPLKLIGLFDKKAAWIPATAIVATTVAMGHFRTLDLNLDNAAVENEERRRSQSNEQAKRIIG